LEYLEILCDGVEFDLEIVCDIQKAVDAGVTGKTTEVGFEYPTVRTMITPLTDHTRQTLALTVVRVTTNTNRIVRVTSAN
jgi:hypothetical protein